MKRIVIALLALIAAGVASPAYSQVSSRVAVCDPANPTACLTPSGVPSGATFAELSGSVANTQIQQFLPNAVGKTTYLCGLSVTGAGATAAGVIDVTVFNIQTTMHYSITIPAGATTSIVPLQVNFAPCIPANAVNTGIGVTVPAFGAGNTVQAMSAWGYAY